MKFQSIHLKNAINDGEWWGESYIIAELHHLLHCPSVNIQAAITAHLGGDGSIEIQLWTIRMNYIWLQNASSTHVEIYNQVLKKAHNIEQLHKYDLWLWIIPFIIISQRCLLINDQSTECFKMTTCFICSIHLLMLQLHRWVFVQKYVMLNQQMGTVCSR